MIGVKGLIGRIAEKADLRTWRRLAPRTAVIMMQKDEDSLLGFWARYHAWLFGHENLFVFDNGSRSPHVLQMLDAMESAGCNVIRDYDDAESFRNRGQIFPEFMEQLRMDGYRLFFLLDCDEFVAVEKNGEPSIDRKDILEELIRSTNFKACQTSFCYYNHPGNGRLFRKLPHRKVLGPLDGIRNLGHGYHSVGIRMEPSRFAYFHYHYRPYAEFRNIKAAQIEGHGWKLDEDSLQEYVANPSPGRHVAKEYLMSEDEYRELIDTASCEEYPCLHDWFNRHLGQVPFMPDE